MNKKNATVTDGRLTEIFSDVGRRLGYDDVRAEFSGVMDFKVRWQRSSRWISFRYFRRFSHVIEETHKKSRNNPIRG